jgi:hypothetical protein
VLDSRTPKIQACWGISTLTLGAQSSTVPPLTGRCAEFERDRKPKEGRVDPYVEVWKMIYACRNEIRFKGRTF